MAVETSSFAAIRREKRPYVDKTRFLPTVLENGIYAQLIARPPRFGKTLFLDTLRTFLSVDSERPGDTTLQRELFEGLDVLQDETFCRRCMGQVPVLYLSLAEVAGSSFGEAYLSLADRLCASARMHEYLLASPRLSENEKIQLRRYASPYFMADTANMLAVEWFARELVTCLAKHFDRPCVFLVDEYDAPLVWAAAGGYYEEMRTFLRGFLSVLQPEGGELVHGLPVVSKSVLTGSLWLGLESTVTDASNIVGRTVGSPNAFRSDAAIGFTESEVSALLEQCGLRERTDEVMRWCGGYHVGGETICRSGDVLAFCGAALGNDALQMIEPQGNALDTRGNEILVEFLEDLSEADAERLQILVDGGAVEFAVREQLSYAELADRPTKNYWALLLFFGCLTAAEYVERGRCRLRIPNEGMRRFVRDRIRARFSRGNRDFDRCGRELAEAALLGDLDSMLTVLDPLLRMHVSVGERTDDPSEKHFSDLLSSLLASVGGMIRDFRFHPGAGESAATVLFTSGNDAPGTGVVLNMKRARNPAELTCSARDALGQIEAKVCGEILSSMRCRSYYAYGLAFCGKHCEVVGGTLQKVAREA